VAYNKTLVLTNSGVSAMSKFWAVLTMGVVLSWPAAATAQDNNPHALSAREIFYTKAAAPAPKPAASPQRATAPPAAPPQREKEAPARNTPATVQTVPYSPLGMRYSLLRRSGSGPYAEVDPETVFHSGDGLRVSVESNDPAYLYIVARGTSGGWNVLFPDAAINKGDNRIEPHSRYEIPAGGQFTFDQQAGTERVFVVLSRTQESDLEGLIYSLDRTSTPAKPAASFKSIVQNMPSIPDELVGKIRQQFASRDLVFEKVDDAASERKEKAMYVVNAHAAADSRVMVDLSLKHQ